MRPVSYTRDEQGSEEELDVSGDQLLILTHAVPPGSTVASMKKESLESKEHGVLVESGDLPRGFWKDQKNSSGEHRVEGVVVGGKHVIDCIYSVKDEKNLEAARAVCKSLKTF